jgi:hypothetical protein
VAELTASLSPDGESVLFSCEDGFTLVGDRNQSCLENSREFESVFDRTRCIRGTQLLSTHIVSISSNI